MEVINLSSIPAFNFYPKQREVIPYIGKGYYIFYGGTRGAAKSHLALYSAVLACLYHPGINVVIVRSTMPELKKYFIRKLEESIPHSLYSLDRKDNIANFRNGSHLYFVGLESEADAYKIKGIEFDFIILDEGNELPIELILRIRGSLRSSGKLKFTPTMLVTGNPGGISDHYFKVRFINPDYSKWEESELPLKDKYVFVQATVEDNPFIMENNPDYINWLDSLPEHLRLAWRYGRWDVFEGRFFEEWNAQYHVVDEICKVDRYGDTVYYTEDTIPKHWIRIRGLDLGGSKAHPTVCLWAAFDPDDEVVYIYREYTAYGSVEQYIDGIKMFSEDDEEIVATYADPSMFHTNIKERYDSESSDRMFLYAGIPLERANNRRDDGWRIVKTWMHWSRNSETGEIKLPRLRIFRCCSQLIETLPLIKYSKSETKSRATDTDQSKHSPDDAADALRYLLVTGFGYPNGYTAPVDEGLPPRRLLPIERPRYEDYDGYSAAPVARSFY